MGSSKNAFIHSTIQMFRFPADKLVIIGRDTKDSLGTHDLWRADANEDPPKSMVDSIRRHGVQVPIKVRKIDDETAEVVMGRDRTKAVRWLVENEYGGDYSKLLIPAMVWPKGTSSADIIGAANAENYSRKTESLTAQATHVKMQLKAEGYFDGVDAAVCIKAVSASTGFSEQRIRNLISYLDDQDLVKAVDSDKIRGEAALAIATLEDKDQRASALKTAIENPDAATVAEVRERVSLTKHANKTKKKKAAAATGKKTRAGKRDDKSPGLSKPLMAKLVEAQMKKKTDERDLDQLVIKAFKAASGEATPDIVPGLLAALRDIGIDLGA